MPIEIGNLREIVNNMNADIRNELPLLDPGIEGSAIKAITESVAARTYDNRQLIAQLIQQAFPQTATEEFLELWGVYDGIERNPGSGSSGSITVGMEYRRGTVPAGTLLTTENGIIIQADATVPSNFFVQLIASATYADGIYTCTMRVPHPLASGITVRIFYSGVFSDYFVVTVLSSTSFTFPYATAFLDGVSFPSLVFIGAVIPVSSVDVGEGFNVDAGATARLNVPIQYVSPVAFVRLPGLEGGSSRELDEPLRARILERRASIESLFNSEFLIETAKKVSGVTRVFVKEIHLKTVRTVGATTVYFMRDGDAMPIPSGVDIQNVNDALQAIRPAQMQESDFLILAPTNVKVDITLSGLMPDSPSMRTNIRTALKDFFTFSVDFEEDVLLDRIRSAMFNAQDIETGEFLKEFNLLSPEESVAVADGAIATLGDIDIT